MNCSEKIAFTEKNIDRQLSWINSADSKTSFVMAINTGMIGIIMTLVPEDIKFCFCQPLIIAIISVILQLISLFLLLLVIFPRLKSPNNSIIFFGNIIDNTSEIFVDKINKLDNQLLLEDLIAQCYRTAEIANHKMTWLKRSFVSLYLSIIPWLITVYSLSNNIGN